MDAAVPASWSRVHTLPSREVAPWTVGRPGGTEACRAGDSLPSVGSYDREMDGRRRRHAELARARYAGGRPNDEAKAIHRRYVAGPLPRLVPIAAVLDVPGRVSGTTIHVPLVIVPYRFHWYLVSMLGERANWVRNVRANEGDAVLLHGHRRPVHLVEVPVSQRAPIVRRYLLVAWGAHPHMSVTWRSRSGEVAAAAAEYPVFRVDRRRP